MSIAYYDGQYGNGWIQAIAKAYKKKNPSVKIRLEPDMALVKKAQGILSLQNPPDILFLPQTNWQRFVKKGELENLTDFFKTKVDGGKTLEQKIQFRCLVNCKYGGKYWVVPWDDGIQGFIYNKKLFVQHKWRVPKTMKGFYSLLKQIKAAGIIPIAWDGDDIANWSAVVNNWWAQCEGTDGMNNYLKLRSPHVYLQKGRLYSLEEYQKLVSDKTNSMDNVISAGRADAQELFYSGKTAMMLGGSWQGCLDGPKVPEGFIMRMMRTPALDKARDASVNVEAAGGFAAIPVLAANKSRAEDFLRFMSTDSMLKLYTKKTSSPRPLYYDAAATEGLGGFGKSVIALWQSSKRLYMFSKNPVYYSVFSDWPKSGLPYTQIYFGLLSPNQAVLNNYEYARVNWSAANKQANKQ